MNFKKIYSVITGDLVKSSSLRSNRREVLKRLKEIIKSAEKLETEKNEFIIFSDIFRGDSFQGVISKPAQSLKVALFIQAELNKKRIGKESPETRIAIGLGTIDSFNKNKIEESDGEAFHNSGQALDEIKSYRRLSILSPWEEVNENLNLLASLLDAIIQRWSPEQAEAISLWLQGKNQKSISEKLGISQPAVQQRLKIAGLFAIKDAIKYFNAIVDKYKHRDL
jgi:predicted XRE-type DNA-binding protein